MFFNRSRLMTALVVLVTVTKSQLAVAAGPHGGGFHGPFQNQMSHQNHTPGQNLMKGNFQKPINFTPNVLKNNIQNPVLQHINKFPGNINHGPLQNVKLQHTNFGNLGQNKGLNFPQLHKNNGPFNPLLNGKFPGGLGNKPIQQNLLGKNFKLPHHHHHHQFPVGGFLLGLGVGSNWGYGWPNYGTYPVVQAAPYGWPVSSTTYVTTSPQVIEVPVQSTTTLPQFPTNTLPPTPAAMTEIDLAITDVRLVDAGSPTAGPMYRVTLTNKGSNNMTTPTRLAGVAMNAEQSSQEPPMQIETVPVLNVGQSTEINLRMPVTAKNFPLLMIAAEVPANFKDTNEQDNVAQGQAAQIPVLAAAMK